MVNKSRFDFDKFMNRDLKMCMWLETLGEFNMFCAELHKRGVEWNSGDSLLNTALSDQYFNFYDDVTIESFYDRTGRAVAFYGCVESKKENGMNICRFSDYEWSDDEFDNIVFDDSDVESIISCYM